MAEYSKEKINQANVLAENIKKDALDAQKVIDKINSFCDKSETQLKGVAWDSVRSSFQKYTSVFDTRKKNAENLSNAMISANNILLAAVGDDIIDTSYLEELKVEYEKYNNIYYSFVEKAKEHIDDNQFETSNQELYYLKKSREIKECIDKIENVIAAESQAMSLLNSYSNVINSYNEEAKGIIVTSIPNAENV